MDDGAYDRGELPRLDGGVALDGIRLALADFRTRNAAS
jgi:hypothetical protein